MQTSVKVDQTETKQETMVRATEIKTFIVGPKDSAPRP